MARSRVIRPPPRPAAGAARVVLLPRLPVSTRAGPGDGARIRRHGSRNRPRWRQIGAGRAGRHPGRARAARRGRVRRRPSPAPGRCRELCAGPVWFKCENLQRTGSFKIRGAYTRIARLGRRRSGPAGWSRPAPATTPRASRWPPRCSASRPPCSCRRRPRCPRSRATRGYGADVHLVGETVDDAIAAAIAFAAAHRRRAGAPVRPPGRHRRPGHGRAGAAGAGARTCARCWSAPAAAGCSAGSRPRSRGSGRTSR